LRIMLRDKGIVGWQHVESVPFTEEAELQKLLAEDPTVIPVDDIEDGAPTFKLAIREVGLPGSGSTDILLFNEEGGIGLIECKLDANPEIKRKVIGQILEYAAYLWNMKYEELDSLVGNKIDGSLAEVMGAKMGSASWNEEVFRGGIEDTLKNGTFHLIIAVDSVNDELRRIINYLNECGNASFTFHALELETFRKGTVEMLVPHIFGKVPQGRQPTAARRLWTEEEFLKQAERDAPHLLATMQDLLAWSRSAADDVFWGRGSQNASFTFHYKQDGKTISVYTVYANGRVVLNYEYLIRQIGESRLGKFDQRLRQKEPFRRLPEKLSGFKSLDIEDLQRAGAESVAWLKSTVEELKLRG